MALFSRVTTWVSNQVLTASALNGEFNNLLNNAVSSSYIGFSANTGQMQQQTDPGGIGTESLAGSISDELQRVRYLLALAFGQTYWYNHSDVVTSLKTGGVVTASIGASQVTTAKIAALNITTALINAKAVTTAKIDDGAVTGTQVVSGVNLPGANCKAGGLLLLTGMADTTNGLGIVRGAITNAAKVEGEGFTVADNTSYSTVSFSTPFSGTPVVIVSDKSGGTSPQSWDVGNADINGFRIYNTSGNTTGSLSFIAIGVRS